MAVAPRPIGDITSYHAHVYYDPDATQGQAEWLRERVGERFKVRLGRWHGRAIGPHGAPMFQISFPLALFDSLVPWLMLNRQDLSVLVHPNTDNQRKDHARHALWLGPPAPLFPEVLEETPLDDENEPNTSPSLAP